MILGDSQAGSDLVSGYRWIFAGREFDESHLELYVEGQLVELELKPLEILIQLLHHAGEIVTKNQLLDAVWPGLEVVEASLTTGVYKLRKALADKDASIVATVPRVGYRLAVEVRKQEPQPSRIKAGATLVAGNPVPGRTQWHLVRPMDASPHSEVWLAENVKTHDLRVFKFASSAARLKALRREVTVFRYLHESLGEQPEFARILEWNFDRQPYFVESEYGGPNLVEWAEEQGGITAVPMEERIRLAVQICRAVEAAHGVGVIHKDLKPANILISKTANEKAQVKIVDFGSASLVDPARLAALGITNLGFTQATGLFTPVLTGTLMYLAPEVLSGQPPTAHSDVYALGVMLYQLTVGDFRKPLAQGWEAGISDAILRGDITQSVSGDPAERLASPGVLAGRLIRLEQRRLEHSRAEEQRQRNEIRERRHLQVQARLPWIVATAVAVIALGAIFFIRRKVATVPVHASPQVKSVAVLPFQDIGSDHSLDFLRFAVPDEIATTLSYNRGLSVRPFRILSRSGHTDIDLQRTGKSMNVRSIVTGHFLKHGNQLQITIEASDAHTMNLLWRDTLDLQSNDLIEMHERITSSIRDGLAPVLGSPSDSTPANTKPRNSDAYKLYLQSVALPDDFASNERAITLLRKAVSLDDNYAPAWSALAVRYYNTGSFGGAGEQAIRKAEAAAEHAQQLDPNFVQAGSILVRIWTEEGHLIKAYKEALDLIHRRPDSGYAHFSLSYNLRYAGLLHAAARQCEIARATDPNDPGWRSCLSVYEGLGEYQRAAEYLNLSPPDSPWTIPHQIQEFVREGKNQEAQTIKQTTIPGWDGYNLLQACAGKRPESEIDTLAKAVKPDRDSELNYAYAAHLAYCNKMTKSIRLLKLSIEGGHCGYPAMETDPLMANLRARPEYPAIRAKAIACQQSFLAAVKVRNLPVP